MDNWSIVDKQLWKLCLACWNATASRRPITDRLSKDLDTICDLREQREEKESAEQYREKEDIKRSRAETLIVLEGRNNVLEYECKREDRERQRENNFLLELILGLEEAMKRELKCDKAERSRRREKRQREDRQDEMELEQRVRRFEARKRKEKGPEVEEDQELVEELQVAEYYYDVQQHEVQEPPKRPTTLSELTHNVLPKSTSASPISYWHKGLQLVTQQF